MPQTTQQQTGYTGYDSYRLPPGLEESMRQRYAEETSRKRKGIAGTFKGKQRALQEQAARMGLVGPGRAAGQVGKGMYDLSAEQAAQEINAQRESEAAMGAEMLGASKAERAYQQQLEQMKQGYGYQSQLLGQQITGTKEIADAKNALDRELAENGWTAKAQMLQAQITSAEGIEGGKLGLGYAGLEQEASQFGQTLGFEQDKWADEYGLMGQEMTLKENALQQQMDIENLKADLIRQGWDETEAAAEAQRLWEGKQTESEQGYFDPETGEYMAGTTAAMDKMKYDFATSLEELKHDYAEQDKIMQGIYDMGQLFISGGLSGDMKFYAENLMRGMAAKIPGFEFPEGLFENLSTYGPGYAPDEGGLYQTGPTPTMGGGD